MRPNCYCFPVSVGHIQPNTNNPENKQQSKIFLNVFPKNQFEISSIYAAFLYIIYDIIEIFVICMCSQSKSHGYHMSVMWGKDAIRWAGITHQWDHASNTPKFENVAAIEYLPKDVSIFFCTFWQIFWSYSIELNHSVQNMQKNSLNWDSQLYALNAYGCDNEHLYT